MVGTTLPGSMYPTLWHSSEPQPTPRDLSLCNASCLYVAISWLLEMNDPLPIPVLLSMTTRTSNSAIHSANLHSTQYLREGLASWTDGNLGLDFSNSSGK